MGGGGADVTINGASIAQRGSVVLPSGELTLNASGASGADALQFVKQHRPELVLMDIGLPGLNGVETTAEILRYHPECKVVILSMYDDENSVVGAVRSGARGFILKKVSDSDLLEGRENPGFAISALKPGYIYDPARHQLPVDGRPEELVGDPELNSLAYRVHQLTDTPYLTRGDYSRVFRLTAEEVSEHSYFLTRTSKAVRDRCIEERLLLGCLC